MYTAQPILPILPILLRERGAGNFGFADFANVWFGFSVLGSSTVCDLFSISVFVNNDDSFSNFFVQCILFILVLPWKLHPAVALKPAWFQGTIYKAFEVCPAAVIWVATEKLKITWKQRTTIPSPRNWNQRTWRRSLEAWGRTLSWSETWNVFQKNCSFVLCFITCIMYCWLYFEHVRSLV